MWYLALPLQANPAGLLGRFAPSGFVLRTHILSRFAPLAFVVAFSVHLLSPALLWHLLATLARNLCFTLTKIKEKNTTLTLPTPCHFQNFKDCPCQVSCRLVEKMWALEGYIQTDTQTHRQTVLLLLYR